MENASKALLIAAGILIGLILITMIIYGYNQISNYYEAKEEITKSEQLAAFNKQYIGYNRKDVRGSELISLVNKIVDYNMQNDDEIEITIRIKDDSEGKARYLYYNYTSKAASQTLIKLNKKYSVGGMRQIIDTANHIENKYNQYGTGVATTLANNVSVLYVTDTTKLKNRTALLTELNVIDTGNTLTKDILKYYQYVQFKRAHFDCKDLIYQDGKVKSFKFEFNGTFE